MDKKEAEQEALQLWRELPAQNRADIDHALAFAELIAKQLPFDTLGNHDKIVAAWLIRDLKASKAKAMAKAPAASSIADSLRLLSRSPFQQPWNGRPAAPSARMAPTRFQAPLRVKSPPLSL